MSRTLRLPYSMKARQLRVLALLVLGIFAIPCKAYDVGSAVVIIYVEFPNSYEIGTGAFIDHDGLILTADHVVHKRVLSPPTTMTTGSVPLKVEPTKILVYSSLFQDPLPVDLSDTAAIVDGSVSATQWLDVALIRVKLSDTQRAAINPFDLSPAAPARSDQLDVYGPLCTRQDSNCYLPFASATSLGIDPSQVRDYQVRANITLGYSGGPLVDKSGRIVAITSWGDTSVGDQLVRASFIPSRYILRYFLSRIPSSSWLSGTNTCPRVHTLASLTVFDYAQVFKTLNLQDQAQCACCCESLDKAANATNAPDGSSCAPPFCAERRFYSLRRGVDLAVSTSSVDETTVQQYQSMVEAFHAIPSDGLDKSKRLTLYGDYGATLFALATSGRSTALPQLAAATDEALQVYKESLSIREIKKTYYEMGALFETKGDQVHAAGAAVLGSITDLSPRTARTKLKIDKVSLQKQVFDAVPSNASAVMPGPVASK